MTVQEFVNIDKDLQTVQDISNENIIILIYLFIKHVLLTWVTWQVPLLKKELLTLLVGKYKSWDNVREPKFDATCPS
jgi:hypothetical protein